MNMTLSKRGDYVMRSAISLARAYPAGAPRKIREVVADTEVPQSFASQILADLVRAGLAMSKAGREGGYRLARPPSEISVLEVIEAAEGPLRAERCALGEGPCRWEKVCPLHETWTAATVALRELLARTTLAELAVRDAAIEAGSYAVPVDAHRAHPVAVSVCDEVQVELGAIDVHAALAKIASRLAPLIVASSGKTAGGDAEVTSGHRGRKAPRVEASLVPAGPVAADSAGANYLLAWQTVGSAAGSSLEADLSVLPVDPQRCELRVEGNWRQRFDSAAPIERSDLERLARETLRSFLRRLARTLEETPGGGRHSPSARDMSVRARAGR